MLTRRRTRKAAEGHRSAEGSLLQPNVKHQRARATASRATERSRCARSAACASSTAGNRDPGGANLPGTRAIRYGDLRNREHRRQTIIVPDVEHHTLGDLASHRARLEVHDEEGLSANDLTRIGAFRLHSGKNVASMVAEVDNEAHELSGIGDVFDREDRTNANVDLLEERRRY